MYYTFFFNVDAVVCQNNGQFQVWELNISQFIVIVAIKYFMVYHRVCDKSNTIDATYGAGTVYPSGSSDFTTGFW
jgi:hypothetical protein